MNTDPKSPSPLSGLYAPTVVERISGSVVRAVIEGQPVSFFVTTELDTIMGQNAYGYFYEIEELAIIARHFRPGSIMLDVGANIGNHTIYAAKFLGARRIICIEPNPEAIMILRINVDLNQLHEQVDMRYLGLGLSDSPCAAVIARTIAMNLGGVELASQAGGSIRLFAGDELLQGQPIDFIKIDVEGMELAVLKGLERTIAECRPGIFVEVDNAHAPAFHALIQHLGYAVVDRFNRYGINENFMLVPSEVNAIITPKAPNSAGRRSTAPLKTRRAPSNR
jgi:FkbM family methyltransferase